MSSIHTAEASAGVAQSAESAQHALAGRIPIPHQNRIFNRYGEFLLTSATLGSASYAYLVGASLTNIGTTWIALVGYLLGLVIGTAFVTLSAGVISYRLGVDAVDASKPCLGTRGAVLMLVGAFLSCAGWANVLLAMTSRGLVTLLPAQLTGTGAHAEGVVSVVGLLLMGLIWLLLRRGAKAMERAASYCAIAQIVVAVLVLGLILKKFGLSSALLHNVSPQKAYTGHKLLQLAYGVEFGLANGIGMVAFIGGLARLVKHKRHLMGPVVIGYPMLGATLVASVGAMAAVVTGQEDLSAMFTGVAGSTLGPWLLSVVMITNVGTMVAQFYIAGLTIEQISLFARLKWEWVVAVVLLPSLVVAFNTQWLLDHVMAFLAYGGVMFVGLSAIMFVDYFLLRRQRVITAHLFALPRQGDYWFYGGVNWAAIVVIVLTCALYAVWFDPITLRVGGPFQWLGASIPTLVVGGLLYYALMKLWVIRQGVGGYEAVAPGRVQAVEVGL